MLPLDANVPDSLAPPIPVPVDREGMVFYGAQASPKPKGILYPGEPDADVGPDMRAAAIHAGAIREPGFSKRIRMGL